MNTVEGVSIGTGSAVLAYFIAKFEIAEKVYSFIKKLFGDHPRVNLENVSGTVGDVAGRDIHVGLVRRQRRVRHLTRLGSIQLYRKWWRVRGGN